MGCHLAKALIVSVPSGTVRSGGVFVCYRVFEHSAEDDAVAVCLPILVPSGSQVGSRWPFDHCAGPTAGGVTASQSSRRSRREAYAGIQVQDLTIDCGAQRWVSLLLPRCLRPLQVIQHFALKVEK